MIWHLVSRRCELGERENDPHCSAGSPRIYHVAQSNDQTIKSTEDLICKSDTFSYRMPFANFAGGQIYNVSFCLIIHQKMDLEPCLFYHLSLLQGRWLPSCLHHLSCLCRPRHRLHPRHPGERCEEVNRGWEQRWRKEEQSESLCPALEVSFYFGFDQKIERGARVVVQVHKQHQQASPRKL